MKTSMVSWRGGLPDQPKAGQAQTTQGRNAPLDRLLAQLDESEAAVWAMSARSEDAQNGQLSPELRDRLMQCIQEQFDSGLRDMVLQGLQGLLSGDQRDRLLEALEEWMSPEQLEELERALVEAEEVQQSIRDISDYKSEEMKRLMELIRESNRQIQESAKMWEKVTPKPVCSPSVLGLKLSAAEGKLKLAELGVRNVKREYNENVPAGHVVSQVPAPGGRATKQSGVTIIISKGPPPEKEKHSNVKKQEKVAHLKIKSRQDVESACGNGDDVPVIVPDGSVIL